MPETRTPWIQVIPEGMLGFFEVKSARNPTELVERLQPAVDLTQWYTETHSVQIADTATQVSATMGTTVFPLLIVPAQEFWFVHFYSVQIGPLAATHRAQVTPAAVFPPNAGVRLGESSPPIFTALAVAGQFCTAVNTKSFILPPAAQLAVVVNEFSGAGNATVTGVAHFARLPVRRVQP